VVLELLASVASTDPAPIAAGLLLLLALGMYPVGILLPSCCACSTCERCPSGTLPETITVTFPEIDDEMLGLYRHRVAVSTTTPWAANAPKVSARVSETVAGEITAIEILDGGSGYALLGRVAPTLTFSGGGGAGATFSPTLTSSGTPPVWTLASATASGGSGYVDGAALTITAANGDVTTTQATATVIARSQPTITATAPGGSGASLAVTLSQSGSPPTWAVSGVSVSAGGTGYTNGAAVTFSTGAATTVTAPSAVVNTIGEPSHTIDASGAGGTGAAFSLTYALNEEGSIYEGWWYVDIAVTNGGSGYSEGGTVLLKADAGTQHIDDAQTPHADFELGYTVAGGAITSVWLDAPNAFKRDTGVIQSVTITNGGSVYVPGGAASGVTVTGGGSYYGEDASASPYVATVTASVENASDLNDTPSVTPVIDTNTASATFGEVTSFTINDGGGGHYYRELRIGKRCCRGTFAERSVVLKRDPSDNCRFIYEKCEGFGSSLITLTIPPQNTEYGPQPCYLETTTDGYLCYTRWTATEVLGDCSEFSFDLESGDRIATVSPGGTYHAETSPAICSRCCTSGELPSEIEVELEDLAPSLPPGNTPLDYSDFEGIYVLEATSSSGAWTFEGSTPGEDNIFIEVAFQHCGDFAAPVGYRKQDPNQITDLVYIDDVWRQDIGVISAEGFSLTPPAAPPPPTPEGWPCPAEDIDTPYANDGFPGTTYTSPQDFVSHCGTDCNSKCFLQATIHKVNANNEIFDSMSYDLSKPYGEDLIYDVTDHKKIFEGYEAFFDYFNIEYCGGSWVWIPQGSVWDRAINPQIAIPQTWPGRDYTQATCAACESNLCDLSGREIIMAPYLDPIFYENVRLTIQ
jgi:hypothetical protein